MSKTKNIMKKTCCLAKSAVKKTQEILELSQINFKIMQLKNKIERKCVKVGYLLYCKQKKDGLDSLKEEIVNEKFKSIFKEIEELNENVKKLKDEACEIKKCENNVECRKNTEKSSEKNKCSATKEGCLKQTNDVFYNESDFKEFGIEF